MLLPGRDSWRTCRGPREGTSLRHVVVALLALALLGPISPSWADSTSGSSTPAQVGYGAGSFLGTLRDRGHLRARAVPDPAVRRVHGNRARQHASHDVRALHQRVPERFDGRSQGTDRAADPR